MKASLDLEIEQLIEKMQKEIQEEGFVFGAEADFKKKSVPKRNVIPNGRLHYEYPLKSSQKNLSGIVLFVKRLIRNGNRFLIVPILEEQSAFNESVKAELDRLNRIVRLQDDKIRKLERSRKELSE